MVTPKLETFSAFSSIFCCLFMILCKFHLLTNYKKYSWLVQEKNWEIVEELWNRKKKLEEESNHCNFLNSTSEEVSLSDDSPEAGRQIHFTHGLWVDSNPCQEEIELETLQIEWRINIVNELLKCVFIFIQILGVCRNYSTTVITACPLRSLSSLASMSTRSIRSPTLCGLIFSEISASCLGSTKPLKMKIKHDSRRFRLTPAGCK